MKKAAIALGVNKCGGLPVLRAAASGATEFAKWADGQGFEVKLLTDDTGTPVKGADVDISIREWVKRRTYSLLVVYFAGHGILKGPDSEYWLLSGAREDGNEAVNVSGSSFNARNSGIPHIVFISDACRSRLSAAWQYGITGRVIFPPDNPRQPLPSVDMFYAALPGDPALEMKMNVAASQYKGVFTEYLLKCLRGEIDEVIEKFETPPPLYCIPSWTLETFLEVKVPRLLSGVNIKLEQFPDIRVESHKPKYLAPVDKLRIPAPPPIPIAGPEQPEAREWLSNFPVGEGPRNRETMAGDRHSSLPLSDRLLGQVAREYDLQRFFPSEDESPERRAPVIDDEAFRREVDFIRSAQDPGAFPARTGISIVGQGVERVYLPGSGVLLYTSISGPNQIRQGRGRGPGASGTALIQFSDGTGMCPAVLEGFIGTVLVQDGHTVSISYTPSRDNPRFEIYQRERDEVDKRRAFASVAMRRGVFRVAPENAESFSRYVRQLKHFDPVLGLYACYAYAQVGLFDQVRSVYKYMSKERVPVLFDVAFLSGSMQVVSRKKMFGFPRSMRPGRPRRFVPLCPLLTQGWALLGENSEYLIQPAREVAADLVPGLWTTFNSHGIDQLFNAAEKGVLD